MDNNKLIEFFEKNRENSNQVAMQLLIYSLFIEKKDITEKQLYLFLDKEEVENLNEEQRKELLQEITKSFNNLKQEQETYINWIKTNIKQNILKVKMNQYNLSQQEKLKVNQDFTQGETEKEKFDFSSFALKSIDNIDDFSELLESVEPLFLKAYKNETSFFDIDFVNKINETSFLNDENKEILTLDFLSQRVWSMKDEIKEELYEKMFEKMNKHFLWPKTNSKDTLFSILGKMTSFQISLFSNFLRGGMKIV